MAVTVPRYEQGQVRQQNLPSARYSSSGADVSAGSIGRGLQQVGGVLGQIADQEKRKVDVAAVMEAESQLRAYQNTMLFGDGSGQNVGAFGTKGRDSFGLPERILPELDKRRAEIAGKLRADQRSMFEQRTADWGVQTQGDLLRHVARESDAYTKETTKAYIDSSAQTAVLYYNNPERVDAEITRAQDAYLVGNPGDPPEATKLALQTIESGTRRGILNRLMVDSPQSAQAYYQRYRDKFTGTDQAEIERVLTPLVKADRGEEIGRAAIAGTAAGGLPVEFDAAVERVLTAEGGYVNDPNDNGGATNYGISSAANPDVDVKNLTPEQAKAIYRERYWNAINADSLPAALRATAFDAAVNQGVGWTRKALAQSGGDPAAFNALRRQRYDQIVQSDPSQRKFYRGWMNRLASYSGAQGDGVSQPRSFADARQFVLDTVQDDDVRKSALSMIDIQEQITKQREDETEKSMLQSINAKVEQADPSIPLSKIVTPQELAWAQQTGRVDSWEGRLKQRAAGTDEATPRDQLLAYRDVVYQAARGDDAAKRELSKYRPYDPKLRMAQSDRDWLAKAQADVLSGDPAKTAKAASDGEINKVIETYSINTLGVQKKKLATDPDAIAFDQNLRLWADQFQRENKRAPTYTEVLKQADLVTLERLEYTRQEPGALWGTNSVDETVADLKIPAPMRAMIVDALYAEGKPVTGASVAAKWRAYLKANSLQ